MKYDYLIVGAGLFGAVFAREAMDRGKTCLVLDRRDHIGGNIYTEEIEGIQVHRYGAHIFHTSDRRVWDYINRYAEFNNYINSPVAVYRDELYNLPFNMNTFSRMWNIRTPREAKEIIEGQIADLHIEEPRNLEEQALSLVGRDVYEKLVKGYTEKTVRICRPLSSAGCPCASPMTTIISMTGIRASPSAAIPVSSGSSLRGRMFGRAWTT